MPRRAFVKYSGAGEALLHERVFLNDTIGGLVTIATPDYDVHNESMADRGVFELVRFLGDNGELPLGVGGARLYRFRAAPTDAEIDQLLGEAIGVVALRGPGAGGGHVRAGSERPRCRLEGWSSFSRLEDPDMLAS